MITRETGEMISVIEHFNLGGENQIFVDLRNICE